MSARRFDDERIVKAIPRPWQAFLGTGEYARARASIHTGGVQAPVDLVARLEFPDERHLTIHLAIATDEPPAAESSEDPLVKLLTPRERTVITLIAMGQRTEAIAQTLHVSGSTVRTHVRNSMSKLGVHTRAQLVAVAMQGEDPVQLPPEEGTANP